MAASIEEAVEGARRVGYPVLVRPSYVLGGRAMVIAYDEESVIRYMKEAVEYSQDRPVLVDHFLEDAIEVDVDALDDGTDVVIAGIMQHIEEAGIHSGDSSCVLPAVSIAPHLLDTMREYTFKLARALKVIGLMNIQFAIQRDMVYVIEVNPRASRTVPYVSTATGVPLAKVAAGQTLPRSGTVFISVNDRDKPNVMDVAKRFFELGFKLVATHGTADILERGGLIVDRVYKVKEGRPNVVDLIKGDRIQLILNTPYGPDPWFDEKAIRRAAVTQRIPTITTLAAALAAAEGIAALQQGQMSVYALQHLLA